MREIDLNHLGVAQVLCCHEVDGHLVDPGPQSCEETLLAALGGERPRSVLLTHIHFDHAGAAGALVRRWPDLEVWVHERGARHLADPERLVASARRLWGDDFERLWGEVVPIPEVNLRVLDGAQPGDSPARVPEGFRVAYAPGHASHHVVYLHEESGTAYCGDVAGVRIGDGPIVPPTPPPDIDVEAWHASIEVVRAWRPERLALMHFGGFADVSEHLDRMDAELDAWAELARTNDAAGFERAIRERHAAGSASASYDQANDPATLWAGLDRYWSKRALS